MLMASQKPHRSANASRRTADPARPRPTARVHHAARRRSRLLGRSRYAGKPACVSMIGLLSSRPPFGRIEQPAEIGSRATDGRPLEQALAEIAVVAAWAFR